MDRRRQRWRLGRTWWLVLSAVSAGLLALSVLMELSAEIDRRGSHGLHVFLSHGCLGVWYRPLHFEYPPAPRWWWEFSGSWHPGFKWMPVVRLTAVVIPLWIPLLLAAGGTVVAFSPRRPAAHCCQSCGYDLSGNTSGLCPECGVERTVS